MTEDEKWIADLASQADLGPLPDEDTADAAQVAAAVRARASDQRQHNSTVILAGILVGVTVLAWQWNKLTWQMLRTSWPAYTSYQRFEETPR